ncbi:hypothetical protein HDV00_009696 [Rhizophlyctis rosea]|nr:hypothetical protein HDV00_009696 [Rhizophlyctis rosea]
MATTTRISLQTNGVKRHTDQSTHLPSPITPPDTSDRSLRLRQLTQEAHALVSRLSPRPQERALRAHIVSRIEELVNVAFSGTSSCEPSIDIVGSLSTGIYLPGGDVDIVIHINDMDPADVLTVLYTVLKSDAENNPEPLADLLSIKPIMTARIPVLKFRTTLGRVAVDITANTRSGSVSTQLVKQWMDAYPTTLNPLVILVKRWLAERKFDEVYTGGLGGYAVANMALAMIMVSRSTRRMQQLRAGSGAGSIVGGGGGGGSFGRQQDEQDTELGRLMMEFFETFGLTLDYARRGVSVRIGRFVDRPAGTNRLRYAPVGASSNLDFGLSLYVEDPADPSNDVCRASYRVAEIREAMAESFVRMEDALDGVVEPERGMLDGVVGLNEEEERFRDIVCEEWDSFLERAARRQAQQEAVEPEPVPEELEGGAQEKGAEDGLATEETSETPIVTVTVDPPDEPQSDVPTDSDAMRMTEEESSVCDAPIDGEPRASCGKRVREGSSPSHDGDPEQRLKPPSEEDQDHHSDRSHEDRGRRRRKKERRRSRSEHKDGKSKSSKKSRGRDHHHRERDLDGDWRHRGPDTTEHAAAKGEGGGNGKEGSKGTDGERRRRRKEEKGANREKEHRKENDRNSRGSGEKRHSHTSSHRGD